MVTFGASYQWCESRLERVDAHWYMNLCVPLPQLRYQPPLTDIVWPVM